MKHFEIPIIDIDRFELVDTIAASIIDAQEVPGGSSVTPILTPEDDFSKINDFYSN